MSDRKRGVEVRVINLDPLTEQASEWITSKRLDLVDKGLIGVKPGYAPWGVFKDALGNDVVVNNEGIGYLISSDEPVTIPMFEEYSGGRLSMNVWEAKLTTEYLAKATTDEVVDLADFVRTFGSRLEGNFSELYRIATNEDSARGAVKQWRLEDA